MYSKIVQFSLEFFIKIKKMYPRRCKEHHVFFHIRLKKKTAIKKRKKGEAREIEIV